MALRTALASLLCTLVVVSACSDHNPTSAPIVASRSGVPFGVGLASPSWQVIAGVSVKKASLTGVTPVRLAMNPLQAAHAYALLGVAQYLAVQEADAASGNGRNQLEAERGAVAGASAAVLTSLFPADAQTFVDQVAQQANAGLGQPHPWFTRGETIGRAVGATILERGRLDGFGADVNPVVPTGPQYWTINPGPALLAGREMPGVTRWFLTSASQFRPGPPPAFGSQDFLGALGEIQAFSAHPTQIHSDTAAYWALNTGSLTAAGFWLQIATDDINARGLSEREATHVYALASATMFDAAIGCWDAKLFYWLVRPWQADTTIHPLASVGRPNHPSYPSGHSCVSSSGAEVLSTFFPEDRERLTAMVTQAGLSRMYGLIHYRFDVDSGQALGRKVARFAIAADASGNSVLTLR